jgi:hypothetical protein
MKISNTWINEDGIEMAWATPSSQEEEECREGGGSDVLEYCDAPKGWQFADDEDSSDDGGRPGRYLIRA